MNLRRACFLVFLALVPTQTLNAQEKQAASPRHITLDEAVDMAMKHNHVVRIANYKVHEKEHGKELARSAYFPLLRNDSSAFRLTDTQFIGIPVGGLGLVGGAPVPASPVILNQGEQTLITSGTSVTQPLMELFKIRAANDVAKADVTASRDKERETENTVALNVHQLYYQILVTQAHREAVLAKIEASEGLNKERVEQVKYGSSLAEEAVESHAQALEAKQDLLATDLQLSDLTMKLNDAIGLPLATQLELDAGVKQVAGTCEREECLRVAREAHPEIAEARAELDKASAAVRVAKRDYLPDVDAYARYSYQDHVPFLVRNFGTFGVHVGFDIFDGGRKRAAVNIHNAQVDQARENLARVTEEVELRVQTAYNKLERTQQMVKVSEELLAYRSESRRVLTQHVQEGNALRSQLDGATSQELQAKTLLLQSQLQYIEARDELTEAMGSRPD